MLIELKFFIKALNIATWRKEISKFKVSKQRSIFKIYLNGSFFMPVCKVSCIKESKEYILFKNFICTKSIPSSKELKPNQIYLSKEEEREKIKFQKCQNLKF